MKCSVEYCRPPQGFRQTSFRSFVRPPVATAVVVVVKNIFEDAGIPHITRPIDEYAGITPKDSVMFEGCRQSADPRELNWIASHLWQKYPRWNQTICWAVSANDKETFTWVTGRAEWPTAQPTTAVYAVIQTCLKARGPTKRRVAEMISNFLVEVHTRDFIDEISHNASIEWVWVHIAFEKVLQKSVYKVPVAVLSSSYRNPTLVELCLWMLDTFYMDKPTLEEDLLFELHLDQSSEALKHLIDRDLCRAHDLVTIYEHANAEGNSSMVGFLLGVLTRPGFQQELRDEIPELSTPGQCNRARKFADVPDIAITLCTMVTNCDVIDYVKRVTNKIDPKTEALSEK
ncbi:unnamed protein product [Phytophthora fragariaefolia]|uniref:Unnamed protein product n=1 Tax=Phytophthora fragariaefolia TaxID=1490495 RepID=A0A9W7D3U2_9STRA|nr:unnamed protein product [Phytophthora fragariaefolia]